MKTKTVRKIRWLIIFFIAVLILSGITAFPVHSELNWLSEQFHFSEKNIIGKWLQTVLRGVNATQQQYPFLFYGFDWLAFAHLVIAILFYGPYKDPVRNKWVIEWGMITCVLIIPLALIAGNTRGIPTFHILIDCSFGIIGIIPLMICRRWISMLEKL